MVIEWIEDGLMFAPENEAETAFLGGLQDLYDPVGVKLEG